MLSAQNRMRSGSDFTVAVRRGRRAGRQSLVVHYLAPAAQAGSVVPVDGTRAAGPVASEAAPAASSSAPLVGFVVARSVGNAVVRNRVERRLRHLMRERLAALPEGSRLVVRAQPSSPRTPALVADLDAALRTVLRSRPVRSGTSADAGRSSSGTGSGSAS